MGLQRLVCHPKGLGPQEEPFPEESCQIHPFDGGEGVSRSKRKGTGDKEEMKNGRLLDKKIPNTKRRRRENTAMEEVTYRKSVSEKMKEKGANLSFCQFFLIC